MLRLVYLSLLLVCFSFLGCARAPARVEPPEIPEDAANAAISQYDKNGDSSISEAELDQVQSIKSSLKRFDLNHDKRVSVDEIAARIQSWQKSKIGLMQVAVTVQIDGRALSDTEIRLIPETFLGSSIQPASALTDSKGRAMLRISDQPTGAGVQTGLYKIVISKKSNDVETIPEKYNKNSTLGVEIASDNSAVENGWILKLTK
jgi:hypothetical protein